MKIQIKSFTGLAVFIFLTTLGSSLVHCQDVIKLVTDEELMVSITDRTKKTISYINLRKDSGTVKTLSRKSIKWVRYEYLTKRRVSFSLSLGGIPFSTANSIKKYMRDNGYDGTAGGLTSDIEYPVSSVQMPVLFECEYLMKPPHGISFELGFLNKGSVKGYSGSGGRSTPVIYYSNPQFSIAYKLYSKSFKSAMQAGVIMNFSNIREEEVSILHGVDVVKDSAFRLGFLVGYTGSLIEKEVMFLRFQTQFRYVLPVKFDDKDLFMYDEKIGLTQFFIGFQVGAKLYPAKG